MEALTLEGSDNAASTTTYDGMTAKPAPVVLNVSAATLTAFGKSAHSDRRSFFPAAEISPLSDEDRIPLPPSSISSLSPTSSQGGVSGDRQEQMVQPHQNCDHSPARRPPRVSPMQRLSLSKVIPVM